MKRIVLIDGENLIHGLRTLVGTEESPASRELFIDYPFRKLISDVLGDNKPTPIYYYGAKLRRYDHDEAIAAKTEQVIRTQSRLVNKLKQQDITFVKAGYLRARETDPCPDCNYQEWYLLEKGVDVGLAVKMLTEAAKGVEIFLVSSDTDLLPAVNATRSKGAAVIFVGYEYRPILALSKAATRTRIITEPMVRKYLKSEAAVEGDKADKK